MSVSTTATRLSLSEYIKEGISLPRLKEGEHIAKLLSWKIIEPVKMSDKEYVRLDLKLSDRQIVDNRFEAGFYIFESQIRNQLGLEDPVPVRDLLDSLKTKQFKIWISYIEVADSNDKPKTYRNINYIAPVSLPKTLVEEETEEEKEIRY